MIKGSRKIESKKMKAPDRLFGYNIKEHDEKGNVVNEYWVGLFAEVVIKINDGLQQVQRIGPAITRPKI